MSSKPSTPPPPRQYASWRRWLAPWLDPMACVADLLPGPAPSIDAAGDLPPLPWPRRWSVPEGKASSQRGVDGFPSEHVRPYQPGDEVRRLDWTTYARTGEPYVRETLPERGAEVWFVLDARPSMALGGRHPKQAVAASWARGLGRAALRAGHRVGVLWVRDIEAAILRPVASAAHWETLWQAAPPTARRKTEALAALRPPGLCLWLSDGWADPPALPPGLARLSLWLDDPVDVTPPPAALGSGWLGAPAHTTSAWVDGRSSTLRRTLKALQTERRQRLAAWGPVLALSPETPWPQVLARLAEGLH